MKGKSVFPHTESNLKWTHKRNSSVGGGEAGDCKKTPESWGPKLELTPPLRVALSLIR